MTPFPATPAAFPISPDHLAATFAHSLWQATVLALLTLLTLRANPARRANLRYALTLTALVAALLAALFTYAFLEQHAAPSQHVPVALTPPAPPPINTQIAAPLQAPPASADPPLHPPAPSIPGTTLLAAAWLAGVVALLTRTAILFFRADRLLHRGTPLSDPALIAHATDIARLLGIRRPVRILASAGPIPAAAGFLFPALLLPAEIAANLPAGQLRVILAHELAHIRRHDYLVNFLQQLIEALLFFNPAVWWLSHQVRLEREACCDAAAVRVTNAPAETAQTLAAFAEGDFPRAALASAGPRHSLLSRIRRILYPHRRVAIALPWYNTVALFLVAGLFLTLLQTTAQLTVRAAEDLLTPAQRIDKLAQIQKETPVESEHHADTITITGRARTADGTPLPADARLLLIHYTHSTTSSIDPKMAPDGTFSTTAKWGTVDFTLFANTFAPTLLGPISPNADGTFPPVDLVLTRGFTARLRAVDEHNTPIPNVALHTATAVTYVINDHDFVSDADGLVQIPNVAPGVPVTVTSNAHGYQATRAVVPLNPTDIGTLTLRRATPATGTVIDARTKAPIANARLALVAQSGPAENQSAGLNTSLDESVHPDATTDAAGHFLFDILPDHTQSLVYIWAPGHAPALMPNVAPGQQNITIPLGPQRILTVHLTGDLSHLNVTAQPDGSRVAMLSYLTTLHYSESSSSSDQHSADAPIENDRATLTLRNLVTDTTLLLPGKQVRLPLEGDVTFNLSSPEFTPPAKRTVHLVIDPASAMPPARGSIAADVLDPVSYSYRPQEIAIDDGRGTIEVTTPSGILFRINNGAYHLPGYWLDLPQGQQNIRAGEQPFDLHLRALPAGLAHGKVLNTDGSAFSQFFSITVITIRPPAHPTIPAAILPIPGFSANPGASDYLLPAIPLGGTYRLRFQSNLRMSITDPFTLNEQTPVFTQDLHPSEGRRITGRLVDSANHPLANTPFTFTWNSPWNHAAAIPQNTAPDGTFILDHVNTDLPGNYTLSMHFGETYPEATLPLPLPSDPAQPVTIQLPEGLELQGTVTDLHTNAAIANTLITTFPSSVTTRTDASGHFHFKNLTPGQYSLRAQGTESEFAVINPDGSTTYSGRALDPPTFRAGDPAPIHLRVQTHPAKSPPATTHP